MRDKTRCPECIGGYIDYELKCLECSGTGEVESFWTREAPKEHGFYWVQFIDRGMEIVKAVNIAGGIYWWIAGQPATTDLLPWQKQIEYWSREPVQFPDPPKDQSNE